MRNVSLHKPFILVMTVSHATISIYQKTTFDKSCAILKNFFNVVVNLKLSKEKYNMD